MSYPNMSYCMCENTLDALRQILDAMDDEGGDFLDNLNETEQQAFEDLFQACEQFLAQAEWLYRKVDSPEMRD